MSVVWRLKLVLLICVVVVVVVRTPNLSCSATGWVVLFIEHEIQKILQFTTKKKIKRLHIQVPFCCSMLRIYLDYYFVSNLKKKVQFLFQLSLRRRNTAANPFFVCKQTVFQVWRYIYMVKNICHVQSDLGGVLVDGVVVLVLGVDY